MTLMDASMLMAKVICGLLLVLGLYSSHGFSGIPKAETAAPPLHLTLYYLFYLVISILDF